MHKLDKYLKKICPECIESSRSRYYRFNNYILRVSDHIGANSSGSYSIIISNDNYILHTHCNGSVVILTCKQILMFVKTVKICSTLAAIAPPIGVFVVDPNDDNKCPIQDGTPMQKRIVAACEKLSPKDLEKFKLSYGLKGKYLKDFSSWHAIPSMGLTAVNFFKKRGITL